MYVLLFGGGGGFLLTYGLENMSLFHFISVMFACKFTYSLVFPLDCKLPVARN